MSHRRVDSALMLLMLCLVPTDANPSQQKIEAPTFDVVSIRARSGDPARQTVRSSATRFVQADVTLSQLIRYAYDLLEFQLSGGPEWIRTDRFEFVGTTSTPSSEARIRAMVQTALKARFGLSVQRVRRDSPVYTLELAKKNRTLGPALRPASVDCAKVRESLGSADRSSVPDDLRACLSVSMRFADGVATLRFRGETMERITRSLNAYVDRQILDTTGLTGTFDGDLQIGMNHLPVPPLNPRFRDTEGPSVFTALDEQFGLKLVPQRRIVDVVIVENATRPTPN